VVDGFAGTGALGLEALSRGAARAVFIESDRRAIKVLRENIRRCGVERTSAVLARDFFDAGANRETEIQNAGLILLDPPYDVEDLAATLRAAARMLAPGGRIVLEHSRRRASPESAGTPPVCRMRVVTAGDSALSFYQ
jgi:16S rRNA (guanine(966)-N(2))-methyltransferase RsmD